MSGEPETELVNDLETMVDRWESDADTFEEHGMTRKSGRLKQCIAEVRHFLNKHGGGSQ